jgi:replication-associated recombination protein RarA
MVSRFPTLSNYQFGEVLSALQKMIRRGNEIDAMYWAVELESGFPMHLWNRLEIIAHEDIGIGDPAVPALIAAYKGQYLDMVRRKNGGRRLVLANAILLMCRAQKNRTADNFACFVYKSAALKEMPIPDVALDMHTARGRQLGRGLEHFYEEGAELSTPEKAANTANDLFYEQEAKKLDFSGLDWKDEGVTIRLGKGAQDDEPKEAQQTLLPQG